MSRLIRWEFRECLDYVQHTLERRYRVGLTAAVVLGAVIVLRYVVRLRKRQALSRKRVKKQAERERVFQAFEKQLKTSTLSAERVNELTSLSINDLVSQLNKGHISPSEALEAYQLKALEAHRRTNCLVEPLLDAKDAAIELQSQKSANKGLLYGVPISIKDCFGIKGYDFTIGCSAWIDRPSNDDSVIVKVLKMQGGIPFVKTNVPQTMISWDSVNPIFGRTTNPYNPKLTSGGSSSGEGALIASRGSILGLGSDIGGSVRIPSSLCGICGLKTTGTRLSRKGKNPVLSGQSIVTSAQGPMSSSVDGLILFMRAVLVPELYRLDPSIPVQPFREEVLKDKKPLTIGYFEYNGVFEVVPSVLRSLRLAKAALEAQGHKVVPWHFFETRAEYAFQMFARAIFADGGREIIELLDGDAVDDAVSKLYRLCSLPRPLKTFLYYLFRALKRPESFMILAARGLDNVTELWNLYKDSKNFQASVIADWQAHGLDGVLCPAMGSPAILGGMPQNLAGVQSYLAVFNLLDFPAGSLPISHVTADDEAAMEAYPANCEMSQLYKIVKQGMEGSCGLPVNVQVVTLPYQEELCLRIMKDIELAVNKAN